MIPACNAKADEAAWPNVRPLVETIRIGNRHVTQQNTSDGHTHWTIPFPAVAAPRRPREPRCPAAK